MEARRLPTFLRNDRYRRAIGRLYVLLCPHIYTFTRSRARTRVPGEPKIGKNPARPGERGFLFKF